MLKVVTARMWIRLQMMIDNSDDDDGVVMPARTAMRPLLTIPTMPMMLVSATLKITYHITRMSMSAMMMMMLMMRVIMMMLLLMMVVMPRVMMMMVMVMMMMFLLLLLMMMTMATMMEMMVMVDW